MWIGIVTRVSGGFPYVRVPDLDRDREYGPVEPIEGVTLAAGERVLVGQLGAQPGTLALIRRLA